MAIAGAARSGPKPADADGVQGSAGPSTDGPTHVDTRPGASEYPTPLPVVDRTYGEDAYGSGRYGR